MKFTNYKNSGQIPEIEEVKFGRDLDHKQNVKYIYPPHIKVKFYSMAMFKIFNSFS